MSSARIVIAGAGCAGAVLATLLARAGYEVTVFETSTRPLQKVGEVLPPSANALLECIGLTPAELSQYHLRSHGTRSAWGSEALVENHFFTGRSGTGWHLDRAAFEAQLIALAQAAGAQFRFGASFDGHQATADFLVDATGRRATLARLAGARRIVYGRLSAVTRMFHPAAMTDTFTLVESVPAGWWYSSLLPAGRLVVSYLSDSDLPSIKLARTEPGFLDLLAQTGPTRVRANGPATCPHTCTAASARLDRLGGDRWLAIGDAALSYDPLSSHGIVSAMGTALHAAETIPAALAGDDHAIDRYSNLLLTSFHQYLQMLSDCYSQEQRWPDEPFWQRNKRL